MENIKEKTGDLEDNSEKIQYTFNQSSKGKEKLCVPHGKRKKDGKMYKIYKHISQKKTNNNGHKRYSFQGKKMFIKTTQTCSCCCLLRMARINQSDNTLG